jgi:RNA polymerase sigma-70 factor (ECF subfamily)
MSMSTPKAPFAPVTLQRPVTTPIELARRAASGNEPARQRLLSAVAPKVDGAVRAVLGAHHPALDDAIQIALIAFVRALPAFRGECDPVGYARVIAVRAAIATRKRESGFRLRCDASVELDELACGRPTPSDASSDEQRRRAMRDLLVELPDEQSEALLLRVGLGWSIEEIARETGVPINTVRSRLRLAKERLRARIEEDAGLREVFDRPA